MELTVDKTIETTNSDGEIEQKVVFKGEADGVKQTLTLAGADVIVLYRIGDPFDLTLKPLQTTLDVTGEGKK